VLVGSAALVLALAVAAGGLAIYGSPERQLRLIEREIDAGGRVSLIGDVSRPRWSRWRAGEGASRADLGPDGAFVLDAHGMPGVALLELAPGTRRTAYRLSAEVRHEDDRHGTGYVGIYLAHRMAPVEDGGLQAFIHLAFNDITDAVDAYRAVPENLRPPKPPQGNQVQLRPRLITDAAWADAVGWEFGGLTREMVKPVGLAGPKLWRRFTVEVTADAVRAWWDGQAVGRLDPRQLSREVDVELLKLAAERPDLFASGSPPPTLDWRGGVGLYVYRSTASFRNVALEPLD
jgi:serine/threonine-protein kinase